LARGWRLRVGEDQIAALLQQSLSVAHRSGAIETKDLERVMVDTIMQEKAVAHPTLGSPTARSLVDPPNARVSDCARGICRWPSAPPSWSSAIRASVQARQATTEVPAQAARPRPIRDLRRKIEATQRSKTASTR